MTLTEDQIKDMVASTEEAMRTAALAAVQSELKNIRDDWRTKDTITTAIRDRLGAQLNEIVIETLADRSIIKQMVQEQLTKSIQGRLKRQLKALEADDNE